jgi:hypothetical protein
MNDLEVVKALGGLGINAFGVKFNIEEILTFGNLSLCRIYLRFWGKLNLITHILIGFALSLD